MIESKHLINVIVIFAFVYTPKAIETKVMMSNTTKQIKTEEEVKLTNPSFEDTPRQGMFDPRSGKGSPEIEGWRDCGAILFPRNSPPDINGADTKYWNVNIKPDHGKTFLTLAVREDESYEIISQQLTGTLKKDVCYQFSLSLAKSDSYQSPTRSSSGQNRDFTEPAVLRLFGGQSMCDSQEMLVVSEPVDNSDWETYEFKIKPKRDYTHISLQAFFVTPVIHGYNGHICLDNASHFKVIDCDN